MSFQEPYLRYQGVYSGMHDSAHNTAQHVPDSDFGKAVKKADEQCQKLYEARQAAAKFLRMVDETYNVAWDAAYRQETGGRKEAPLPCSMGCALADTPCGYLSKDGKRLCLRNWETM